MVKKYIGLDLGAESGRWVVAEINGGKIKLNEVHRFITHTIKDENGLQWDILKIFNELITGLTNARKSFGTSFDGISIDTWAVDYVLLGNDGGILGNPHHYRDNRTDGIMEQAFKVVPKEKIYNKTGIQFAQFNTIFQLLAEKKFRVDLLKKTDKFLLIPDFLTFLLTGQKKAEYTNASTTGIIDPDTRNWSLELINEFELPRNIFPEIVEPGTIIGNLLPSIAAETGLYQYIPVIAGASHDTASAVASVPAYDEENWAFLSSGTWSLMGVELKHPLKSNKAMDYNFTNEGGVEKTIRFLKNIIGLWPVQECRRYWKSNGNDLSYSELTAMAKNNGFAKTWINLNDSRFLKSGNMPEKILDFLKETNQTVNSDIGFIIEVILESLAFSYREAVKMIEEVTGRKINKLFAIGGGIQNELLTQLLSDAIGREVIAGPIEGTITGNIGVQAIATGAVSNLKEWRKIVSDSFDMKKYVPVNADYFNENEKAYMNILKI